MTALLSAAGGRWAGIPILLLALLPAWSSFVKTNCPTLLALFFSLFSSLSGGLKNQTKPLSLDKAQVRDSRFGCYHAAASRHCY